MTGVVIFSGGLDSAVLLFHLRHIGKSVEAISMHYGQRHSKEVGVATMFCSKHGFKHQVIDLGQVQKVLRGSSQTDTSIAVPHGSYDDPSMKITVVPNRNMILLAVGAAATISAKANFVSYAAHAGDHTIYPDCRPEFIHAMENALLLCDWHPVKLLTPFIGMNKADIVRIGADLGVPFDETWTCYEGGQIHCGRCGSCTERREAFQLSGVTDPTAYLQ